MTTGLPEPMRCPECRAAPATPDARVCATHGLYLLDAKAMAQLDQAPLLGQVLDGKYALIGLLGGGGYGSVYRGLQQPLGREVAVKVLHGLALTMKVARERFEREAQALSCLTSVHTVRLIDYGITREGQLGVRNLPYMVMELVEGEDLERRLRRGPLSASELLEVLDALADSLDEAHAQGIMHRDLKPSNVLIARDRKGRTVPKVIDFGIARWTGAARSQTGFVTGTPAYMSPEQARGHADLDGRVDVYALAAMTFELVSGRPPYPGDDAVAVLTQQCTAPIPSLRETNADPGLWCLDGPLARGLAKDRTQRPDTIAEFVAECRAMLDEVPAPLALSAARAKPSTSSPPTRVAPVSFPPRATAMRVSPNPGSAPPPEPPPEPPPGIVEVDAPRKTVATSDLVRPVPPALRPRRRLPLTLGLGGVALAVAALWVFWSTSGNETERDDPTARSVVETQGAEPPTSAEGRAPRSEAVGVVESAPPHASAAPATTVPAPASAVPATTLVSAAPPQAPAPPSTTVPASASAVPSTSVASAAPPPRRPPPATPSRAPLRVDPTVAPLTRSVDEALAACRCGPAARLLETLAATPGGREAAAARSSRLAACKPVDIDHKCVDGRLVEVR
ncbi:MAG: protein kinase domain-containing protein [Bradymonadia bacterium]